MVYPSSCRLAAWSRLVLCVVLGSLVDSGVAWPVRAIALPFPHSAVTDSTKIGPLDPPDLGDSRTPAPPIFEAGGLKSVTLEFELSQVSHEGEATQAEADRLYNESFRLWRLSQWREALELLEQALVLYREVGDRQGEGGTLNGLGAVARAFGQYPQALDYYQQALGIIRKIGDRAGEGTILNNIESV